MSWVLMCVVMGLVGLEFREWFHPCACMLHRYGESYMETSVSTCATPILEVLDLLTFVRVLHKFAPILLHGEVCADSIFQHVWNNM